MGAIVVKFALNWVEGSGIDACQLGIILTRKMVIVTSRAKHWLKEVLLLDIVVLDRHPELAGFLLTQCFRCRPFPFLPFLLRR